MQSTVPSIWILRNVSYCQYYSQAKWVNWKYELPLIKTKTYIIRLLLSFSINGRYNPEIVSVSKQSQHRWTEGCSREASKEYPVWRNQLSIECVPWKGNWAALQSQKTGSQKVERDHENPLLSTGDADGMVATESKDVVPLARLFVKWGSPSSCLSQGTFPKVIFILWL